MKIIGWADLSVDPLEGDGTQEALALESAVNHAIEEVGLSQVVDVSFANGALILRITIFQNRDRGDTDRVLELLRRVGELGPASYGVFYKRDDDTSESLERFVLKRGTVEVVEDDLFSPIIPTIADDD